jgi:tetratricopeptide (TPR) repeat protein
MQNPFYLRSLVSLVQNNWQEIPTDRFELVEYTCWAALHREAKKQKLDPEKLSNLLGEDSLHTMENGEIGSWFNQVLKSDEQFSEQADTSELTLSDAIKCAEGAGLFIRTHETPEKVTYRYLHQLVQEALVLIYLKNERFKNEEYSQAKSLVEIGKIHLYWWKLKEAQENLQRSLELCPTVGANEVRASILLNLSKVCRAWRNSKKGIEYAETALQLIGHNEVTSQLAEIYDELAELNGQLCKNKLAEKYYHLALEVYEQLGEESKYAYEIFGLVDLYRYLYKISKAMKWCNKALDIFKSRDDKLGILQIELQLAVTYNRWGEVDKTIALCTTGAERSQELKDKELHLWNLVYKGYAFITAQRFSEALEIFEDALHISRQEHWQTAQFRILIFGFSYALSYQGKCHRVEEILQEALILAKKQINPSFLMTFYFFGLAYTHWVARDFQKCAESLLKWDSLADEEARINLRMAYYFWLKWAQYIGIHSNTNLFARIFSEILWRGFTLVFRLGNPSHWIGRQLYRTYQYLISI